MSVCAGCVFLLFTSDVLTLQRTSEAVLLFPALTHPLDPSRRAQALWVPWGPVVVGSVSPAAHTIGVYPAVLEEASCPVILSVDSTLCPLLLHFKAHVLD